MFGCPAQPRPASAHGSLWGPISKGKEGRRVYTYKGKEERGPTSEADESDEREDVEGGGLNPCKVMAIESTLNKVRSQNMPEKLLV